MIGILGNTEITDENTALTDTTGSIESTVGNTASIRVQENTVSGKTKQRGTVPIGQHSWPLHRRDGTTGRSPVGVTKADTILHNGLRTEQKGRQRTASEE